MERYFLGSNTHKGFYGFYSTETAKIGQVYLIKGGAGTGKSSLMKKALKVGREMGYMCESWHCSGDPNSLDGVYIKDIDKCVIDATSPHAVEPKIPVAKDSIVNLLDYVDKGKIIKYKDSIAKLLVDKNESYTSGYEHLNIAYSHFLQSKRIVSRSMDKGKIKSLAKEFAIDVMGEIRCQGHKYYAEIDHRRKGEESVENRFYRAITPDGIVVYDDHLKDKEIWVVKGEDGSVDLFISSLLSDVAPTTVFYNPLSPDVIDGFVVGDIVVVKDIGVDLGGKVYNIGIFEGDYDKYAVSRAKTKMKEEIDVATDYFAKARNVHLAIEKFYISAMDFDGVNELTCKVIEEIFDF